MNWIVLLGLLLVLIVGWCVLLVCFVAVLDFEICGVCCFICLLDVFRGLEGLLIVALVCGHYRLL